MTVADPSLAGPEKGSPAGVVALALLVALATASAALAQSPPAKVFNPDISAIGNFLAIAGHNTVDNQSSLSMRESEVGLQAVVDPYARADFFISFGTDPAQVVIEEGYITFLNIPGELL